MGFADALELAQKAFIGTFGERERVEFRPHDAVPFQVGGIFTHPQVDVAVGTEAEVSREAPQVDFREAELVALLPGGRQPSSGPRGAPDVDRVLIRGKVYRLSDVRPDGEGMLECPLHEDS